VIPYLDQLDAGRWKFLTISSDNGPHFAQNYIFHALSQFAFPTSVVEVRWAFDCPYHGHFIAFIEPHVLLFMQICWVACTGKDLCDPEGGCAKRRLNTIQLKMQKAFDTGRTAFEALKKDPTWTRLNSQRACGRLDTFFEYREAIWVESKLLQQARAKVPPKLSPLPGIRSKVYGLRFAPAPGLKVVHTARFMCYCAGCKTWPRQACSYPGMSQTTGSHVLRVLPTGKPVTKKELRAFLFVQTPRVVPPHSRNLQQLLVLVADNLTWTLESPRPIDEAELKQAVTKRIRAYLLQRESDLQAAEDGRLQAEHEQRSKIASDNNSPASVGSSAVGEALGAADSMSQLPKRRQQKQTEHEMKDSVKRARVGEASREDWTSFMSDRLCVGMKVSVLYEDAGWCSGQVERVTNKTFTVKWDGSAQPSGGSDESTSSRFHKTTAAEEASKGDIKFD
jgi:hypothetical protein